MALVLSLHSGQDFYVGDEQVVVGAILGVSKFEVTVASSGRKYVVSDEEATELHEIGDVFLSAGDRPQAGVAASPSTLRARSRSCAATPCVTARRRSSGSPWEAVT